MSAEAPEIHQPQRAAAGHQLQEGGSGQPVFADESGNPRRAASAEPFANEPAAPAASEKPATDFEYLFADGQSDSTDNQAGPEVDDNGVIEGEFKVVNEEVVTPAQVESGSRWQGMFAKARKLKRSLAEKEDKHVGIVKLFKRDKDETTEPEPATTAPRRAVANQDSAVVPGMHAEAGEERTLGGFKFKAKQVATDLFLPDHDAKEAAKADKKAAKAAAKDARAAKNTEEDESLTERIQKLSKSAAGVAIAATAGKIASRRNAEDGEPEPARGPRRMLDDGLYSNADERKVARRGLGAKDRVTSAFHTAVGTAMATKQGLNDKIYEYWNDPAYKKENRRNAAIFTGAVVLGAAALYLTSKYVGAEAGVQGQGAEIANAGASPDAMPTADSTAGASGQATAEATGNPSPEPSSNPPAEPSPTPGSEQTDGKPETDNSGGLDPDIKEQPQSVKLGSYGLNEQTGTQEGTIDFVAREQLGFGDIDHDKLTERQVDRLNKYRDYLLHINFPGMGQEEAEEAARHMSKGTKVKLN